MYILNIEETLCGLIRRQSVVKAEPIAADPGSELCTEHGRSDHTESVDPPASRHHLLMTLATSGRFPPSLQIASIAFANVRRPVTTH